MSLKDTINKVARQARADNKKGKPSDSELKAYYDAMEELHANHMLPLIECLEGLAALTRATLPYQEKKFYFSQGHSFQPRHFRFDAVYSLRDPNELGHVGHQQPFFHDIASFVIVFNQQGAVAGREAIDEMKGRYHIAQDAGMRNILHRLAEWAAYKAPHHAGGIVKIFTDVERKYGLTVPRQNPGARP